jgi:hypothetical protein
MNDSGKSGLQNKNERSMSKIDFRYILMKKSDFYDVLLYKSRVKCPLILPPP